MRLNCLVSFLLSAVLFSARVLHRDRPSPAAEQNSRTAPGIALPRGAGLSGEKARQRRPTQSGRHCALPPIRIGILRVSA
jgi:hypothetical protein